MSAPRSLRPWLIAAIVFVVGFDLAFLSQRFVGAYGSEFGGHPDEAAHYVTGLFVKDAIATLPRVVSEGSLAPLGVFKQDAPDGFYAHYPKVALGVWPPFFYIVQSAWTLPFGESRTSMLLLMCAIAGVLAILLYRAVAEEYGEVGGGFAVVMMLSLPLWREYNAMIMAESLSAVTMFGAMVAWGRYLDSEKTKSAVWFGIVASLAILTKGTGLALALAAPLALALAGKWRLLARRATWIAAGIVVVLAGPWTWYFRDAGREKGGWLQPNLSWGFTREATTYYGGKLLIAAGSVLIVFVFIGIAVKLLRGRELRGRWMSMIALIVAVFALQITLPVGLEARHLIPALPACVALAIAGIGALARARVWAERTKDAVPPRLAFLAAAVFVFSAVVQHRYHGGQPAKHWSGFQPLVAEILSMGSKDEVVLVSSDATGEGMFIAEMAMAEKRPGRKVRRGSKELARMEWSGRGYEPRFTEPDDLVSHLRRTGVDYVVVDDTVPDNKRGLHHDMLKRVTAMRTDVFVLLTESSIIRDGILAEERVKLYSIKREP